MSVTAAAFYVKLDAGTLILVQLPGYYFRINYNEKAAKKNQLARRFFSLLFFHYSLF